MMPSSVPVTVPMPIDRKLIAMLKTKPPNSTGNQRQIAANTDSCRSVPAMSPCAQTTDVQSTMTVARASPCQARRRRVGAPSTRSAAA